MSNKTSDKEVASLEIVIKDCREHLKIYGEAFITASELDRIENILAELEQKDKQIKELEEELEKANRQLDLDYVDENFMPRQVVKDVLQNNRNELFGVTYLSKEQYKPYEMQIERINKIEQELLEGER